MCITLYTMRVLVIKPFHIQIIVEHQIFGETSIVDGVWKNEST